MREILIAKNISKSYDKRIILNSVSLGVQEQELVCILGKSGAGKTSLLHILGSLDLEYEGQVYIQGKTLSELKGGSLAEFRNRHIGFVFQFHNLLPEFSALENVALPALIASTSQKEAHKKAEEWLDYLGLKAQKAQKPNELSGGEQQRVAVARALINKPKIILADEPSGSLDSTNSKQLHELFVRLKNDFNQTFIITTHNQDLASIADRCIRIQDGIVE